MSAPLTLDRDYFVTLFDEFKNVPVAKVNAFMAIAIARTSSKAWGNVWVYACALLTAHMLASTGGVGGSGGDVGGPVTSATVGAESIGYGTVDAGSADALLATTRYGIEYVALRRSTVIVGATSGGPIALSPYADDGVIIGYGGGLGNGVNGSGWDGWGNGGG